MLPTQQGFFKNQCPILPGHPPLSSYHHLNNSRTTLKNGLLELRSPSNQNLTVPSRNLINWSKTEL